jgi:hypothetical protein
MSKEDKYVFVSYSAKDSKIVEEIVYELNKLGIKTWTDYELKPGTLWADMIAEALKNVQGRSKSLIPSF